MEETKTEQKEEKEPNITYGQKGIFQYVRIREEDCRKGYLYHELAMTKSKEEVPTPWIERIDMCYHGTGSADGRVWVQHLGNIVASVGIPMHMIKDELVIEFFPTFAPLAVKDVINKYCPGQYMAKFPNDIVCRDHLKKTGGMLIRKEGKFVFVVFCVNLIWAPPDELLRPQGLKACCLKNHTDNVPEIDDFLYEVGLKLFEYIEKYRDLDSILKLNNEQLGEFKKKTFRLEINNPKADLQKDGVLWKTDFPNALVKGYLNGEEFEEDEHFWDVHYFSSEGDPSKKKADLIMEEKRKKKEEEKKNEEKKSDN